LAIGGGDWSFFKHHAAGLRSLVFLVILEGKSPAMGRDQLPSFPSPLKRVKRSHMVFLSTNAPERSIKSKAKAICRQMKKIAKTNILQLGNSTTKSMQNRQINPHPQKSQRYQIGIPPLHPA